MALYSLCEFNKIVICTLKTSERKLKLYLCAMVRDIEINCPMFLIPTIICSEFEGLFPYAVEFGKEMKTLFQYLACTFTQAKCAS